MLQRRCVTVFATETGGAFQSKVGTNYSIQTGGFTSLKAEGEVNIDGSTINLNSGLSVDVESVDPVELEGYDRAEFAAPVTLPPLKQVPSGATNDQKAGNQNTPSMESAANVVPQHQPWSGRSNVGDTFKNHPHKKLVIIGGKPVVWLATKKKIFGKAVVNIGISSIKIVILYGYKIISILTMHYHG